MAQLQSQSRWPANQSLPVGAAQALPMPLPQPAPATLPPGRTPDGSGANDNWDDGADGMDDGS